MKNPCKLTKSRTLQEVTINPDDFIRYDEIEGVSYIVIDGVSYVELDHNDALLLACLGPGVDTLINHLGQTVMCSIDDLSKATVEFERRAVLYQSRLQSTLALIEAKPSRDDEDRVILVSNAMNKLMIKIKKNTSITSKHNLNNAIFGYLVHGVDAVYPIDRNKLDEVTLSLSLHISDGTKTKSYKTILYHMYYKGQAYVHHDYVYHMSKIARVCNHGFSQCTVTNKVKYAHGSIRQRMINNGEFDLSIPEGVSKSWIKLQPAHKTLIKRLTVGCGIKGIVIDKGLCDMIYKQGKSGRVQKQASLGIPKVNVDI